MPNVSLGSFRVLSLLVIAFIGVMVEVAAPPFGLPELPDTLTQGWDRFYTPMSQEAGFLGAVFGALATALLQYKENIQGGFTLILTPISVVLYLSLPNLLPATLDPGAGGVFLLVSQIGILFAVLSDMQPDEPGRPSYLTALGYLIGLVMYLAAFPTAVQVPSAVLGTGDSHLAWGAELLAVLVVPAFLIFAPTLKGIWHRPAQGFWFAD